MERRKSRLAPPSHPLAGPALGSSEHLSDVQREKRLECLPLRGTQSCSTANLNALRARHLRCRARRRHSYLKKQCTKVQDHSRRLSGVSHEFRHEPRLLHCAPPVTCQHSFLVSPLLTSYIWSLLFSCLTQPGTLNERLLRLSDSFHANCGDSTSPLEFCEHSHWLK